MHRRLGVGGEHFGRRVEERGQGEPWRGVVGGVPLRLQRSRVERGHDEQAAAIVIHRLGEQADLFGEPRHAPRGGRGHVGQRGQPGERGPHGRKLRRGVGRGEPGGLSHRLGDPDEGVVHGLHRRGCLRAAGGRDPTADRAPRSGRLLEEPHEPCAAHVRRLRPKGQPPPGHESPPELLDLRVCPLEAKLAARGHGLPPALVDRHEPVAQFLTVFDVRRRRVLEPLLARRAGGEQRQAEERSHFLVLGDQEGNLLPGGRPGQPIEQQLVGLPADQRPARAGRQFRSLGVADRVGHAPGECVERHDAAVFEHRNLTPLAQGR